MNVAHPSPQRPWLWTFLTHGIVGLFVALLFAVIGVPAHAAPPPAGTSISNQASATYSDGSGVARTVTSNLVQTTVTQVYSMTLTANGAQNATPGSVVYYPHTLTNTGNGTDTFNLAATSGTTGFTMSSVQIFADNGSGQPTGSAITSTGAIASGASFRFIVVATLPATATNAQTNAITVTGTSVGLASATGTNTDTTTVTSNAVVTLTKAISVSSGSAGSGPYTYTLTYTNTGNSDASSVVISDAIPAGMTYVAGSGRWSVTGTTALSDAGGSVGSSPNTATSTFTATGNGSFAINISKVTAGQSGQVSFQVNVNAGVAPGVISNVAGVSYNNGSGAATGNSNTVPFTVSQTAGVTLTGATVPGPVAAGTTVTFTNSVKNTGNGTDTFNITLSGSTYPTGTTFQLYKSDGTTPLVDTNGDGTVDTGPLAAGATYNVIVKATLPPNAGQGGATGPFSVNKTATSVLDSTKTSTGADTLTAVTPAAVDLTNTNPVSGTGAGPEASAQQTLATNPGTSITFALSAKNTGSAPDSYNLLESTSTGFASAALPTGWTVVFKADGGANNCSTTGATITSTGTVAAGGSVVVCAVVSIPATGTGALAGTTAMYFRTQSSTSGAVDTLYDAVTVNAVRSLAITPNGTGQTYPGGSYVYTHTLTNNGNVTEALGNSTLTPALNNPNAGWTATLYADTNNNGSLDASDTLVTGNLNAVLPSGLAPGASITLFVKVIAPSGAAAGTVNATTVTITTTNGTYTTTAPSPTVSTDSTSVIAGNLTLAKAQALDTACAGPGSGQTYSQAALSAKPGQCVLYQITVTNVGAADATNVVVSDATPSYTTMIGAAATTSGQITAPAAGSAGTVTAYIGTGATTTTGGTLSAGQSAVITFAVKISQ